MRLPLLALAAATLAGLRGTKAVQVHADVSRTLRAQGSVNVIITMKDQRPDSLVNFASSSSKRKLQSAACYDNPEPQVQPTTARVSATHVRSMVDRLVEYTQEQHQEIMQVIQNVTATTASSSSSFSSSNASSACTTDAKSLWISNEIVVRDASTALIQALQSLDSLGSIREEQIATLSINEASSSSSLDSDLVGEWGVERVHALEAWKHGYLGSNVRVASIDSGVLATHETLRDNFLGAYGWYDVLSNSTSPIDPNGHGTGTMGIMAGRQGIGMAPQVSWMACRACDDKNSCREGDLIACAQFLTCPFNVLNGSQSTTDCSKKPHVINNSWNMDRGSTAFKSVIDVWINAGIIPVFVNGNTGPACATVTAPADSTSAITVGATDYDDQLAAFSARGPGTSGEVKPDLIAPGVDIVSAGASSDDDLTLYSGTSVAAPHASGAIALLLHAAPGLTLAQVKRLLLNSTDTSVLTVSNASTCGAVVTGSVFPNNAYGYGRLNVWHAIQTQLGTSS